MNPKLSKTPQAVLDVFNLLLEDLAWKLADATPWRIILDSAFVNGLHHALGWVDLCDPTLGDLHPSLSNADHTAQMINKLRDNHYPHGTGLEGKELHSLVAFRFWTNGNAGAYHILAEHAQLPLEKHYMRCVEEHQIPGEGRIHIAFEIEAWFPEYLRSIVVARAFTTSQSPEAHHILFNRIFAIVHEDTGQTVQFRHIHGVGFDTFMADGHIGQALGLGLCCEEICRIMAGYCAIDWTKALHMLTPYECLARIYHYCFAHFVRNVLALKGHISLEVQAAMMSVTSAEPLPNFKATLQQIRTGGKKAGDWLKNKQSAGGFALAALYQPASKISIEVWKALPSTSNSNKQAYRSINRDGVKLMMLAGIMHGMQYDSHAMTGLKLLSTYSISSRDQQPTHFRRAARVIVQSSAVQNCTVQAHDVELQTAYWQLVGLHHNVQNQCKTLKHTMETGKGVEKALKKLRKTDEQLQTVHAGLGELASQSSGTVAEPLNLSSNSSVFTAHAHNEHLVVPQMEQ
ncbi:hypothetical protein K439DRAFT_1624842 [Ramaria rubella]|nr:hypothetical protein K439DRAFT_1624842 [Ramaria rubella]